MPLLESHVSSEIESAEVVEEETTEEEAVGEAGGYYTKGVWKLIDAHGADAVLREMLRFLHAEVIQDFTNHMNDANSMSFESDMEDDKEDDYSKTFKTPHGKVTANWDFNSQEYGDFDVEDEQLQDIMMSTWADDYGPVDHDNLRDFIKAAMKKRKGMSESPDMEDGGEDDASKTWKTPYGKVTANWSFYAGEYSDFDAEDEQLQDILMSDESETVDHDNVVDVIKAALRKRKGMTEVQATI